jgi:hypothetical protein
MRIACMIELLPELFNPVNMVSGLVFIEVFRKDL